MGPHACALGRPPTRTRCGTLPASALSRPKGSPCPGPSWACSFPSVPSSSATRISPRPQLWKPPDGMLPDVCECEHVCACVCSSVRRVCGIRVGMHVCTWALRLQVSLWRDPQVLGGPGFRRQRTESGGQEVQEAQAGLVLKQTRGPRANTIPWE